MRHQANPSLPMFSAVKYPANACIQALVTDSDPRPNTRHVAIDPYRGNFTSIEAKASSMAAISPDLLQAPPLRPTCSLTCLPPQYFRQTALWLLFWLFSEFYLLISSYICVSFNFYSKFPVSTKLTKCIMPLFAFWHKDAVILISTANFWQIS